MGVGKMTPYNFDAVYLENGALYGVGLNRSQIGNGLWSID